ncbi:cytochrome P450 [Rhodoferax sp.]|uniref:cytochrome P450 n=1 Tax=Rhodoferax sp. TaxID=50421 RepID=UPI00284C2172|nr:cytochrome P450 [Rhodoferax sp.]MDR3367565.1 cytochrome P450 [Rhodoferax sp.]
MSSNPHSQSSEAQEVHELREITDLPTFVPYFTDEDGFAAVYQELFADPGLGLMKIEGFGPLKLAVFRNSHLRSLMVHPALTGNTPPVMLSEQAFYSVIPDEGKEDEARRGAGILARYLANQIFTLNPPLHRAYRNVLARHMMADSVAIYAPLMRDIVAEMLSTVANKGPVDFLSGLSGRVAARFWGTLIGMTEQEEARVVELMHGVLPMFNIMMSPEDLKLAGTSMGEYMSIVSGAVERAQAKGDNELINTIAADFAAVRLEGDPYTVGVRPESVGMLIASNLFDGFHTAGAAAANCVYRLLTNPTALANIRNDRSLVPNAVFEGLRLDPPLTLSQRYAMEDFNFEGVRIPKGTQVAMLWGAGNRDPQAFPDPDIYDLSRPQRGATSFGGGARMCMGRSIAQLLIEKVIEAVTAPGITMTLTGEGCALLPLSLLRQFDAMPVSIVRATLGQAAQ